MPEPDSEIVLDCPKCTEPMRKLKAGDMLVDRCEKCYGIWLDADERVKVVKDRKLVAGLDVGSPEQGRVHDAVTTGDCPRCGEALNHTRDRAQKHVGFEFCRKCGGTFLDAGELTDLSEFTLSERIRATFGH